MPDPRELLQDLFKDFPGIGARQAGRFVDFLVRRSPSYRERLARAVTSLGQGLRVCVESRQRFYDADLNQDKSPIARDPERNRNLMLIVAKERDLEAVETMRVYRGTYFVLGGLAPMLQDNVDKYIDVAALAAVVSERAAAGELQEIIFGLPVNPEGDHTRMVVTERLAPLVAQHNIKISTLGRGLSTGTELEYSDVDTFASAWAGRA